MEEPSESQSQTITELHHRGEAALRADDYKEALHALDQALRTAKAHDSKKSRLSSLALLDLRVQVRLSRKRYHRAGKDAETMIRLDKTDPRGYMNLGQIKRLQGNDAAALKHYSKGLKRVPTTNPTRRLLKTKHKTTLLALTHSKRADPVAVLPVELLDIVLSHCHYREATALIRVSKDWRDAILSLPLIRTTLDFSSRSRPISGVAFKACIRRLSGPPSTVIAEELSGPATRELKEHLARWCSAKHVELRNIDIPITTLHWPAWLEVLVVGEKQKLNKEIVCKILSTCSLLRRASFSFVKSKGNIKELSGHWMKDQTVCNPQMDSLTIQGLDCGVDAPKRLCWPTNFFDRYPHLQELCLSNIDLRRQVQDPALDFSTLSHLRSLTLERISVDDFPALPPSLEVLKCRAWPSWLHPWPMQPLPPSATQPNFMRLRTILFIEMGRQILPLLRRLPQLGDLNALTQLDLHESHIGLERFTELLERGQLREVKSLRISVPDLHDGHLDAFFVYCPNLETLVLTNTRITGVFVRGLITALGSQLKRLVLGGMDSKLSHDAIEWAQRQGVEIH